MAGMEGGTGGQKLGWRTFWRWMLMLVAIGSAVIWLGVGHGYAASSDTVEGGDILLGILAYIIGWLLPAVPLALALTALLGLYIEAGTQVWLYCERHGLRCPAWADPYYNPRAERTR